MNDFPASDGFEQELPQSRVALSAHLIEEFNTLFPTEKDSVEELYRWAEKANMLSCRYCGNRDVERQYGQRVMTCRDCKEKTWLTAGTLLERARKIRPWVACIWLLEHGVVVSSSWAHRNLEIAQSSALVMIKKITTVIVGLMQVDATVVSSSLFSGVICRRSRETPARVHPLAEQDEIDKELLDCAAPVRTEDEHFSGDSAAGLRDSLNQDSKDAGGDSLEAATSAECEQAREVVLEESNMASGLSEAEMEIYELLSEQPVQFDILCQLSAMPTGAIISALTMLELAGMVVRQPGDRYTRYIPEEVRATTAQSPFDADLTAETRKTIGAFLEFMRRTVHGISRKYLQNYLAAYWCHVDRTRWNGGSLMDSCLTSAPVCYARILSYVSPPLVSMKVCC